ncbi:MAG: S41 family peptidase [Gammaproteobacteria bacterium]|nr:S41 family peptidase [Gammaproteobacteria bacterium]
MKYRHLIVSIVALSISLGAFSSPGQAKEPVDANVPVRDLRAFAEIFGRIKQDYVEPVDDRELLGYAIRGMLSGLDPHSAYLDEEEFRELKVGTSGEFGGLGIEVGMENGFVKVISPIDDTPAQRAGVQAGDLIVRLNGNPVKGMSLNQAVKVMRGKPGTELVLTIVREGEDKPITLMVQRDVIKVASVKGRMLEKGFGYLRISHFQSRTNEDMIKLIARFKRKSGGRLKGLVLDLRNNPGGVLNGAVAVSDAFLKDGVIVYTQGRKKESRLNYNATPDDVVSDAPIVVLVNGGSASASEIVAGALQDHKRAIIMGSRTFGKGSVQTIVPVNKSAAVKLTTARYFTPSGRSIQAEGIVPDIPLSNVKVTAVEPANVSRLKESDLSGHLENGNGKDASGKTVNNSKKKKKGDAEELLAQKDYQLNEALNLLKGLYILNGNG